jgi:hypothetical protein
MAEVPFDWDNSDTEDFDGEFVLMAFVGIEVIFPL